MITVHWWVIPLAIGFGAALSFGAATVWFSRLLARIFALLAPAQDAEPAESQLPTPMDPWSSLHTLHDGLREPAEPQLPKHDWLRDLSGPLPILPPIEPQADVAPADEEPKPRPRERFNEEPKAPKEMTVTTVVADEVRSEKVQVPA